MIVLWQLCVCRRIPYVVALKHKHGACAALLNPASAEPLVWPSPLKFISELNQEAKALLEQALMDANKEREKNILKGTVYSLPSPSHSETGDDDMSEVIFCLPCGKSLSMTTVLYVHHDSYQVPKYISLFLLSEPLEILCSWILKPIGEDPTTSFQLFVIWGSWGWNLALKLKSCLKAQVDRSQLLTVMVDFR